jgi:hypothetical protein
MNVMSTHAAADFPPINPAERALRLDAIRQADASNRLEGGITSPGRVALNDDYIAGRIDLDAYVARSLQLARHAGVQASRLG